MLLAPRVGAVGGSYRFCFAKIGPEVLTYGLRGEAPAEGSKQLKNAKCEPREPEKNFLKQPTRV